MKKTFLLISLFFIVLLLTPSLINAQAPPQEPLVPCGNPGQSACTINDFFTMLGRIFNFIVWYIATPLAILSLTIGGVIILISAGNPSLFKKGIDIFWVSVIGLVLVFCSWLIVSFILGALGYTGTWNTL